MNSLHKLLENEAFLEASREELRVLIALIAEEKLSTDEIAVICDISRARASSAASFWRELGVLDSTATITMEFEERLLRGEIDEEPGKKVARDIRDKALAGMLLECARLMGKAALSTTEVKKIAALNTQYALSEEYILTLAAYMAEKGKLTAPRLVERALSLVEKNIDTAETLEAHIKHCESENAMEREFKYLFGISDRLISPREKQYFKKWCSDYGYFTEIVGLAYDICIQSTAKLSYPYIDRVLTVWYEAGCRTVSECLKKSEEVKFEFSKKRKKSSADKPQKEKQRYGDFDVKDAFKRALERSYGTTDKK